MIGSRIIELRKALGLTQAEFAARLKLHTNTVSKWELSKVKIQDYSLLLLELVFEVNPDWLKHGQGNIFLPKAQSDISADLEKIFAWQKSLPRDKQIWLKIEMARCFPEFEEWLKNNLGQF